MEGGLHAVERRAEEGNRRHAADCKEDAAQDERRDLEGQACRQEVHKVYRRITKLAQKVVARNLLQRCILTARFNIALIQFFGSTKEGTASNINIDLSKRLDACYTLYKSQSSISAHLTDTLEANYKT